VEPLWKPPGQPTRNPKVERCNGLAQQWGELHRRADNRQAARVLAWAGRIQREEYPAIRGRTRREVLPHLSTPRRVYRRSHEAALWDLSRVDAFLARGAGGGASIARDGSRSLGLADRSVGLGLTRTWCCGSRRPHGAAWSPIQMGNSSSRFRRAN